MLLSSTELDSLNRGLHRSPHSLLGMHPLGDGSGIVVRALIPNAREITVIPVHESKRPGIPLKRIGETAVFEGVATGNSRVFAHAFRVVFDSGHTSTFRDPYSFLPSLGETDLHLFAEGNHRALGRVLGAHLRTVDGATGVSFAVWAPNAKRVSVVGDFNTWDGRRHPMRILGSSGIWEIFIPGVTAGSLYKFEILDAHGNLTVKTDPFGRQFELPPKQAAIVTDSSTASWSDQEWMTERARQDVLRRPISIYEVHLGSWMKKSVSESPGYREIARPLVEYVIKMGFTHVEFLPLAEHAYYPSWGYQITGFYAPTSRYGTPDDLKYLINELHRAHVGVIMDWVPAHFPRDTWALARFDGTALYEHEDPRQGAHQDWGTLIFNFGRHEVRNFLSANALFWLDEFHLDGLRVDAVASMLYLDYSRQAGEWIPNQYGGRENLEAVEFLRQVNHLVHTEFPGVVTIAEESTAWPMVTRPPYIGGLGFNLKWNMGWMHDTLGYFKRDPIHRKFHQNDLTFAMLYHGHENFTLPLSHDEVVHGKGSLRKRMPGDDWQAFANLRVLFGYQWMFPGKKLLFMGGEIGQTAEWNSNSQVDWWLLKEGPYHTGAQQWVKDLNALYQREPALWRGDYAPEGFQWIDCSDHLQSVLSFIRRDPDTGKEIVVILNLTPETRSPYRIGFPRTGMWREILNSDAAIYGGSGVGNAGGVRALPPGQHGQSAGADLTLPPLGVLIFGQP